MRDITPKIVFNPKGQKNNSKEYLIYYLIRLPGSKPQKKLYNSGIKIHERFWIGKEHRWVSEKHPIGSTHNALINRTITGFLKYQAVKKLANIAMSWELIDKFFLVGEMGSFNDFVKAYNSNKNNFKEHDTWKKYKTFEKYLDELNSSISFHDINHSFFNQYKNFLIVKKKNAGPTIEKNFDPMKRITKSAMLEGFLTIDPFTNYRLNVDLTPGAKSQIRLTDEEVTKIRDLEVPEHMPGLKRDKMIFMFCYYCAIRISDLRILTWENIKVTKHGIFVDAKRDKTDETYLTPLYKFKNAMTILKNQRKVTGGKGYIFCDTISADKYNKHVKKLASLAKIEKNITNTTARKSSLQSWYDHGAVEDWLFRVSGHKHKSMLHEHYIQTSIDVIASRCEQIDQRRFDI